LEAIIDTTKVGPVVGIRESPSSPSEFFLGQNYPNPFNPATTIDYQIPMVGDVIIRVYDVLGREVRTLLHDMKNAGKYEVKFDATDLPTGVYFYRLQAGTSTETKRLTILK
jgi:hypothetical protein